MTDRMLTTGSAAYTLGVSTGTLRRMARQGRIPFTPDGFGKMSFKARDVDRLKLALQREQDQGANRKK